MIKVKHTSIIPDTHVSADSFNRRVDFHIMKSCSPDEARAIAVECLVAADEADGDEEIGGFGYEASDSKSLGELRSIIDECLGWEDDEQELEGDYAARVRQVGALMKRNFLKAVK